MIKKATVRLDCLLKIINYFVHYDIKTFTFTNKYT